MSTTPYPDEARVDIAPFVRQVEGDQATIGLPDAAIFLTLPVAAVEILDDLARGCTVGEARQRYLERHGEQAHVVDLLQQLAGRGFVRLSAAAGTVVDPVSRASTRHRYHLQWVKSEWASFAFGRPALSGYAAILAAGAAAAVWQPQAIPSRSALIETENMATFALFVSGLALFTTLLHEVGHVLAARARGVACRLGIGNRLWILVAETDMTGVWALPRQQRLLPILAGPLVDLVSLASVQVFLSAHEAGWLVLGGPIHRALQAAWWIYLLRLLWQCYFFLRTDFYYAATVLTGCANLMGDTEDYLRSRVAAWRKRGRVIDQSHLPEHEQRAVRAYAWVWLAGRGVVFGVLLLVQLPLLLAYAPAIWARLVGVAASGPRGLFDVAAVATLSLVVTATGLVMWWRELRSAR